MKNLELKYRCTDLEAARRRAEALGARDAGVLIQADTFFPAPGGRLKLREFPDGSGELIAYRRSDGVEVRASDYRIFRTEDGAELRETLCHTLGTIGTVRKRRQLYLFGHTRIHLDEVEGLDTFVELEAVMEGQEEEEARAELDAVVTALELRREDGVAVAYVDLLAARG